MLNIKEINLTKKLTKGKITSNGLLSSSFKIYYSGKAKKSFSKSGNE